MIERCSWTWMKRLSPMEYLGLHLGLGLLLSLFLLGVFWFLADQVIDHHRLAKFDEEIGLYLRGEREQFPAWKTVFLGITQAGSVTTMTVIALLVGLVLLLGRHPHLAMVWLFSLAGSGLLDEGLKLVFNRDRPWFRDPTIHETTKSFPSGHSMGSIVGYGLLAYLMMRVLPRTWQRWTAAIGFGLLVLAIGFSRMFLGAHYFSDVLAGYAVGGAWLAACISGLEAVRRKRSKSAA
jgi:undecaprenyl-diphosphatase